MRGAKSESRSHWCRHSNRTGTSIVVHWRRVSVCNRCGVCVVCLSPLSAVQGLGPSRPGMRHVHWSHLCWSKNIQLLSFILSRASNFPFQVCYLAGINPSLPCNWDYSGIMVCFCLLLSRLWLDERRGRPHWLHQAFAKWRCLRAISQSVCHAPASHRCITQNRSRWDVWRTAHLIISNRQAGQDARLHAEPPAAARPQDSLSHSRGRRILLRGEGVQDFGLATGFGVWLITSRVWGRGSEASRCLSSLMCFPYFSYYSFVLLFCARCRHKTFNASSLEAKIFINIDCVRILISKFGIPRGTLRRAQHDLKQVKNVHLCWCSFISWK